MTSVKVKSVLILVQLPRLSVMYISIVAHYIGELSVTCLQHVHFHLGGFIAFRITWLSAIAFTAEHFLLASRLWVVLVLRRIG